HEVSMAVAAPERWAKVDVWNRPDADKWERDPPPLTDEQRTRVLELLGDAGRLPTDDSGRSGNADRSTDAGPQGPMDRQAEVGDQGGDAPREIHEVQPPRISQDYYTDMPPSTYERYFVRDQNRPIPLFDGPPAREQVAQGYVGDCGVLATVGAVAGPRPDDIRNAIKDVGDGKFEVTLHDVTPATRQDPVARPTGETTTYVVSDDIPVAPGLPGRPPAGVQASTCGWPALLEKTVAAQDQTWEPKQKSDWDNAWTNVHKYFVDNERFGKGLPPSPQDAPTGYDRIDIGSTAYQRADLLAELTGEEAEVRDIPDEQQGEQALLDEFRDRLDAGKPVLVGTRGMLSGSELMPYGVYAGHAYEVTKIDGDKIHLRNPWGRRHPAPMEATTFWEYFRWYNQDGSRSGQYTTLK
ncbi:MAG TPA: hypothetical protein VI076_08145, partial [Actinopolymorphaceae bacterium]